MSILKHPTFVKTSIGAVVSLFTLLMFFVVFAAYNRHSGITGMDAAKIQKIRIDAKSKES